MKTTCRSMLAIAALAGVLAACGSGTRGMEDGAAVRAPSDPDAGTSGTAPVTTDAGAALERDAERLDPLPGDRDCLTLWMHQKQRVGDPELEALVSECYDTICGDDDDDGSPGIELKRKDRRVILNLVVEAIARSPRFVAQLIDLEEIRDSEDNHDVDRDLYPNIYRHQGTAAVPLAICPPDVWACESAHECWFHDEEFEDLGGIDTPAGEARLRLWSGTPFEGSFGEPDTHQRKCDKDDDCGDFPVVFLAFEHRPAAGVRRLLLMLGAFECCWSEERGLWTPLVCSLGYGTCGPESLIALEKRNGEWKLLAAVEECPTQACRCLVTGDWQPCAAANVLE